jgi:hypothetical protein
MRVASPHRPARDLASFAGAPGIGEAASMTRNANLDGERGVKVPKTALEARRRQAEARAADLAPSSPTYDTAV